MTHKVFVYGTLKSMHGNHRLLAKSTCISLYAITTHAIFDMYRPHGFPYVLHNGTHKIKGELYEVDDATKDALDRLEGYPHFYNRSLISIYNPQKGELYDAWMYYIDEPRAEDIRDREYGEQLIVAENNIQDWG